MSQVQVWQGQFPPPEAIERYENVMPGAFNRLMVMAERQQDAAIAAGDSNRRLIQSAARRGHWMGFAVTLAAMVGAGVCAYLHQVIVAGLFLSVPVLSVSKALIDSAKSTSAVQIAAPTGVPLNNPQPQGAAPNLNEQ